MKVTFFLAIALILNYEVSGQSIVINNPSFSSRTSSLNRITKVELTDTSTNLYFNVKFGAGWDIVISDKSYIRVGSGGEKLPMKSFKDIPVGLNATWVIPPSGEVNYSMSYPKVDASVETIDFMDEGGGGGSWNIFDIELKPQLRQSKMPENLLGNWLKADGSNQWMVGFFDNLVVYDNDFWSYDDVTLHDKKVEVTLKNKTASEKLLLSIGKNEQLMISKGGASPVVNCRKVKTGGAFQFADEPLSPYAMRLDTTVLRGYLHRYSPKMGFKKGILRVADVITGTDKEYLIDIAGDGTFEIRVPMNHPTSAWIYDMGKVSQSVYLTPGATTLVYIDMESHIAFARSFEETRRNRTTALFMGDNAPINASLLATDTIDYYSRESNEILPMWVKLKREGDAFTSFVSKNGSEWKRVGQTMTIPMSPDALVGLCVTSHTNGAICKATLSNVMVNNSAPKPSSWRSTDIGEVALAGKTRIPNGVFAINGSGADIWGGADAFRFVFQPLKGDGEIVAKVEGYTHSDHILKVGVMVRESLLPGARYAMSAICPAYHGLAQTRSETGGISSHNYEKNNLYTDMDLQQYTELLKRVRRMEEEALIKLQQEVSLNPQAVQLARIRMDLSMMRKLLRFSSNSVYAKREAAQAKGAGIEELTDGSERLDTESIEFVNGVVGNPLSLYLNEYNYGLMALKYYTYAINRKQRTVNLRSVFDALEKENVQFTPVEKEWMADMKQLLGTEEKEQHVDSVGRALVYEKYGETQKEFDKKYAAMIERAYFDSYVNFDIAAVESLLGEESEMLADLIRVQACCHHLETRYVPLSDVSLAQYAEKLADRKIFDLLVAENDALKATIAANKLKTGYTVNAVPRAEGDELFDAMLAKFRGKLVYVDFWATWCGPCRHGIKRIVPLKEEIENEDVVFVYITNQTSPLSTWENAITDIKGEHFRVSDDEWKVLKAKFNISGIPHYALVAKDGTLLNGDVPHYDNDKLKQLLESHL